VESHLARRADGMGQARQGLAITGVFRFSFSA
jgi:hypothetical protein